MQSHVSKPNGLVRAAKFCRCSVFYSSQMEDFRKSTRRLKC
ncbi:hypothetical protein [Acinetobacter sp. ANC 3813]